MNWISPLIGTVLVALWFVSMADVNAARVSQTQPPPDAMSLRLGPPLSLVAPYPKSVEGATVSRGSFDPQRMRLK